MDDVTGDDARDSGEPGEAAGALDLEGFSERVAALKHDLGKYVAWMSANLDDATWGDPDSELLTNALQRDLLRTRTRVDGSPEAAWEVWARLAGDLPKRLPAALQEHAAALGRVASAVETLKRHELAVRAGGAAVLPHTESIRGAQRMIRAELRSLHRALRRR